MTFTFLALAGAVVAGLVTAFVTPAVRRVALRRGWTDQPDGRRKTHKTPTASVGGLAIVAGVAAGLPLVLWAAPTLGVAGTSVPMAALVGAALVVATGWYDDVRGLGFKAKLLVETGVAFLLMAAGYQLDLSVVPFIGDTPLYVIPITLLWIVGVMNAVNLIDGVDGLASGVAMIAFLSMAMAFGFAGDVVLVLVALVFVGALAGFLVHNFNPASIFMGDSGSLFLGYALVVYSLSGPTSADPRLGLAVPILALGLPLLDTALSMVRRGVGRRSICAPDRDHIHHRMVDRMGVKQAVLVLYAISALFGVLALLASLSTWSGVTAVVVAASSIVIGLLVRLGYVRLPYTPPQITSSNAAPTRAGKRLSGDGATTGRRLPELVTSDETDTAESLPGDPSLAAAKPGGSLRIPSGEGRTLLTKTALDRRPASGGSAMDGEAR
ncbi:MAG: MraY family glycosyltransferase [Bacteroidota bacterium]